MHQERGDMKNAEKADFTTIMPETAFEELLNAIRDSPSNHACSDHVEDVEAVDDDDEDPKLCKLSEDNEPSWVIGTISNTVQNQMERSWQKRMNLDELV
jgi:hypothetical protein